MPGIGRSTIRLLQGAACVVIVAWGIKAASHILSIIFVALLLSYVILPLPKWLMHRFHLPKSWAISLTVVFVAIIYVVIALALVDAGFRFRERLPNYEAHFRILYERIEIFLDTHGIQTTHLSLKSLYSSDRIIEFTRTALPTIIGQFSDRFLISLLSLLFLIEMANPEGALTGPLARNLAYYGSDVQGFITVSAETGAINAVANFVILVALGIDFPVIWCFLYFFLHFIPNIGFLISLIPPTLIALLMFGWKRAVLVTGGLILTEMLGDYVVKPMLMFKEMHVSLLEIMLSLMIWGFLLGTRGVVVAIPLTLALRKFLASPLVESEAMLASVPEGNRP
jgi:AI-2 transport protein TqsA